MMPPESSDPAPPRGWAGGLEECAWDEIHRPGCYVFVDTGDLVRVPVEGLSTSLSPVIAFISRDARRLVRVSHDFTEAVQVLRTITAARGYKANY